MNSKRIWVVELIMQVMRCDKPTAEMLVERLMEEGLLVLGYGDKEVDRVVIQFTESFGTTRTSRQDRWAAQRLVRKYGENAVVGIIRMLSSLNAEDYSPVVNSVDDLERKWVSVVTFLRKHQPSEDIEA
jgi:hypothetical protein